MLRTTDSLISLGAHSVRMKRRNAAILGIGVLAVVTLCGFYLLGPSLIGSSEGLTARFYDRNGHEISGNTFSIVGTGSGSYEGVYYIQLIATVKNTGERPLQVRISNASPASLRNALPSTVQTIAPGDAKSWASALIETVPFDGTTQTFMIQAVGTYDYAGQQRQLTKSSSLILSFARDPVSDMDLSLGGSVGDSSIGVVGTKKSTGTSCAADSECVSGICNRTAYTVNGRSCGSVGTTAYTCSAAVDCYSCSCQAPGCNAQEAPKYIIACQAAIPCETVSMVCA